MAMLTCAYTIFNMASHAFCKNFEGLFGGIKLWRIHWNLPTFSQPKLYTIRYQREALQMPNIIKEKTLQLGCKLVKYGFTKNSPHISYRV